MTPTLIDNVGIGRYIFKKVSTNSFAFVLIMKMEALQLIVSELLKNIHYYQIKMIMRQF